MLTQRNKTKPALICVVECRDDRSSHWLHDFISLLHKQLTTQRLFCNYKF